MSAGEELPSVVVVGAGFAGLAAACALAGAPVRVAVVDGRNHHLFQPLLYQVATAALNRADIAQPIRRVLRPQRNAEVLLADVTGVDLSRKRVLLAHGEIAYRQLILATGYATNVLTFDYAHAPVVRPDIVLCVAVIRRARNAAPLPPSRRAR